MKNYITPILVFYLLLLGCGETEQEKQARIELSSIIRQLNANNQNLLNSKKREESLNLLSMRGFYQDFIKGYENVRLELSKLPATKKFYSLNKQMDTLINLSIEKISTRQDILLSVSSIGSDGNSLNRNVKNYYDYRREAITSRYSSDYYSDRAREEKTEFLMNQIKLINKIADFRQLIQEYDSINVELIKESKELNQLAFNFDFSDSLNVNILISDTTDFVRNLSAQITSFQTSLVDIELK